MCFHKRLYFICVDQVFLYVVRQMVVYQFGGNPGYRLFSCRIDMCEYDLVQKTQAIREVMVELLDRQFICTILSLNKTRATIY